MTNRTADPLAHVSLRPLRDDDLEFIYRVYASTRQAEMALTGWSDEEQEKFLRMQFHAQHTHYQNEFREAAWDIVERAGEPIGRLYVDRRPGEIRAIDIALLPSERGNGIGCALMRRLLEEAAVVGKMVRIHVERNNPAMHLYDRLGFRKIEDQGVYWLMEWDPRRTKSASAPG